MEKERKCGVCKGTEDRICCNCRGEGSKVKQNRMQVKNRRKQYGKSKRTK